MEEKLDIQPLIRAYNSFINMLQFAEELELKYVDEIIHAEEGARSAVIHDFEYTFELSCKMMKRYIEIEDKGEKIVSKRDLFRIAGEKELIYDFHKWVDFLEARNKTSHTYDEEIAEEVYQIAKEFKTYVEDFITALKEHINYDEKLKTDGEK
ncbi:MAG: nucleotidyltransferase substrate binding protein [Methanobrevibacter sp.]|jgi:nucleotidyltransferase substrate binding protein (TIGR01987 family)|nr:nucleotidyltransferase substrate binding protein [Methanobrevibacter sp.]